MRLMFYLALPLCLVSCAVPAQRDASGARGERAAAGAAGALNLDALGRRIWQNECAGSTEGLVSWNSGEDFPSLGIGHFIWFPAGVQAPFDESFPRFVAYARQRGVQVPSFFLGDAPWANKQAFLADRSGRADAMRRWLAGHVRLQTEFIVLRSREALGRMMSCSSRPQDVQARYRALAATTQGMYCLVDYVNFKGALPRAGLGAASGAGGDARLSAGARGDGGVFSGGGGRAAPAGAECAGVSRGVSLVAGVAESLRDVSLRRLPGRCARSGGRRGPEAWRACMGRVAVVGCGV